MIEAIDYQLIEAVQHGLPVISRPYAAIAEQLNIDEREVLERLSELKRKGLIKRLGVIVNHRHLGYQANAMLVWDIPDHLVEQIGEHISRFDFINLCYLRPRRGELWPYNLYCMIHGKSREKVLQQLEQLVRSCGLGQFKREILFSRRCFKQRGAIYRTGQLQYAHG